MAEDTSTTFRKEESSSPFRVGQKVDRFEIQEVLSEEGSLSWVYRATDTKSHDDRPWVVKIPRFDRLDEFPTLEQLFVQEGESRMRLFGEGVNPRNLLVYRDIYYFTHPKRAGDIPFVVAEYLEGRTLAATTSKQGRLPPDTAFEIAEQVLEGLSELHRVGVVHRDLKPANIMLLKQEPLRVKIIDLGIAANLARDQGEKARGWYSPTYAADELVFKDDPHPLDATTDLFSFGVLLYELFDGHPYDRRAQLRRLGGREHQPQSLDRLVRECCHDRFAAVASQSNLPTLRALEMLREARRTYERLKETGTQDTDDRSALRTQLDKLKGKYEGWLDVNVPLEKRLLCLQQMEDVLSRLGQPDPGVQAWRASLDEEAAALQTRARQHYEALLKAEDWEGLDRWEEGDAGALEEDERRTLVARKNKTKAQRLARERYHGFLEAMDWESLGTWEKEEGAALEEAERRHLLDEARLAQATELAQAGDPAGARVLFNMLVTEGATSDVRRQALDGLGALLTPAPHRSLASAGCLLVCSVAPQSPLLVRSWPSTLYLGRGSLLNRKSGDPDQQGRWSHITLMCDESAVSAEVREKNRAISRRHLSLTWQGKGWHYANMSGFMAVRLGDRQVAGGESGSLDRFPDAVEILKAQALSGPWEIVLTLAATTISEGSEETPPSLLLESRDTEIAACLRWLLVGTPVAGEKAFPSVFAKDAPFRLLRRGGKVFVEALKAGSRKGKPMAKGTTAPLTPGERLAWGEVALECCPVPNGHEAFLEDES
jgi:serine/threonine protein kinase